MCLVCVIIVLLYILDYTQGNIYDVDLNWKCIESDLPFSCLARQAFGWTP